MDENSCQNHLELIQLLLTCPSGEETMILEAHPELVDAELVQAMLSVSEQMAAHQDEYRASWLRSYGFEIAHALGMVAATFEEYEQFLMQVLKAIAESNGDPQVVYPLLQANLDKLDDGFTQTLQTWATDTLAKVEPQQRQSIAFHLFNLGNLMQLFPLGDKGSNQETGLISYQYALDVYIFESLPVQWAATQQNLANAYGERIRGDKAQNLEKAIACYHHALEVYTREAIPVEWANAQYNLAITYSERILADRDQSLEDAIACFHNALEVRTREAMPVEWAATQYNLAGTYIERTQGEKAQNIEDAIACFHNALEVRTREAMPVEWAATQNHLAAAYRQRILGDEAQNKEEAIACFHNALEVYTREAMPKKWADTQNNLAIAYSERILGDQAQNIEEAIAYHHNALEVCTREAFPQSHIETLGNMAITYKDAQQFTNAYKILVEAIETVESLLGEIMSGSEIEADRQQLVHRLQELYQQMMEVCLELNQPNQAIEYIERGKSRSLVEFLANRNLYPQGDSYPNLVEGIPFSDIQALIDDNTAMIEWYIADDRILTFIVTPQNPHVQVKQSSSEAVQALVNLTIEEYFSQREDEFDSQLNERLSRLAEILQIEEIIAELPQGCKQLVLIPHRFLYIFPLHALPIEKSQKLDVLNYLLDLFPQGVRYAPSCQLLQLSQNQQHPDFRKLFAIQNPTGDIDYSDLEVKNILPLFPYSRVLAKGKATATAVKTNKDMLKSHCHHFACYGDFNLEYPLESALILAQGKDSEDIHLTLTEILRLNLHKCRLVTLSACKTAITPLYQYNSPQYLSLPSAFLYAGSASVVSSLWRGNGFSTAFLMIKFYQNLSQFPAQETGAVAVALNQAQIWLRDVTKEKLQEWTNDLSLTVKQKSKLLSWFKKMPPQAQPFQSPYYWAAFCAIGK
ncbi:MAG: CHAT domain-containing protein [Symploca sp. SIO3E6]|nr:CHAT domain-containing protein [Caldora sp. SIO3E6]